MEVGAGSEGKGATVCAKEFGTDANRKRKIFNNVEEMEIIFSFEGERNTNSAEVGEGFVMAREKRFDNVGEARSRVEGKGFIEAAIKNVDGGTGVKKGPGRLFLNGSGEPKHACVGGELGSEAVMGKELVGCVKFGVVGRGVSGNRVSLGKRSVSGNRVR